MEMIATFPTTQAALGAERTLLGEGLPVELIPVPSQIHGDCGFCLRVRGEGDPDEWSARLRDRGAQGLWRVTRVPAGPASRRGTQYERIP
jgi:hypothetical protein